MGNRKSKTQMIKSGRQSFEQQKALKIYDIDLTQNCN